MNPDLKDMQTLAVVGRNKVKSSIYLLPNIITASSLFFGMLAMMYAIEGRLQAEITFFSFAAYALLAAAVCDGLEGSVARFTHTQSAFGVQLDSLSDAISFGVAPAIVMYNFSLHQFHRLGFFVCFAYALCGVLRLARFNVQTTLGRANGNFTGIPIPMAAAPLAVYLLAQGEMRSWLAAPTFYMDWQIGMASWLLDPMVQGRILLVLMFSLALGMISTFEYLSHKSLKLPRRRPFRMLALVLIAGAFIILFDYVLALALFLVIYSLHGPVRWLFTRKDRSEEEEEIFDAGEE